MGARTVNSYCKETQIRSSALQLETAAYSATMDDGMCLAFASLKHVLKLYPTNQSAMLALQCLALLFSPLKTKKIERRLLSVFIKVVPVSLHHHAV